MQNWVAEGKSLPRAAAPSDQLGAGTTEQKTGNASLAIHQLPVEIFEYILTWTLACEYPGNGWWHVYPRLGQLKRVCVTWAYWIDSCPTFWSVLTNRLGPRLVPEVVARSRAVPLHVDVAYASNQAIRDYLKAIKSASHRWYALTISRFKGDSAPLYDLLQIPAPRLQRLAITGSSTILPTTIHLFGGEAPLLRRVEITTNEWNVVRPFIPQLEHLVVRSNDHLRTGVSGFGLDAVMQVLAASPNIESIELTSWEHWLGTDGLEIPPNPIVLGRIRNFTLNRIFGRGVLVLLRAVRLPLDCTINIYMTLFRDWGPLDPALDILYRRFHPATPLEIDIRIMPSRVIVALGYERNGRVRIHIKNHHNAETGGGTQAILEYVLPQLDAAIRSSGVSVHLRIGRKDVGGGREFTISVYKSILEVVDRPLPSTTKASIYGLHYHEFISYTKLAGFPNLSELIIDEERIVAPWEQLLELAKCRSSLAADPGTQVVALDSISLPSRGLNAAEREKLSGAIRRLNWTDDPNACWTEALPTTFKAHHQTKLCGEGRRVVT